MLHGYSKHGDICRIDTLLKEMNQKQIYANLMTYSSIAHCVAQYGVEKLLDIISKISRDNIDVLDVVFFNGVLSGLSKSEKLSNDDIAQVVDEMYRLNIPFNSKTYKNLLVLYSRTGLYSNLSNSSILFIFFQIANVSKIDRYIEIMELKNIPIDSFCISHCLKGCSAAG